MAGSDVLTTQDNAELLSYIINQDPLLSAEIDLPVQGQDIAPIGKIIVNNQRYKNAFLNIVNVIGLTIINDKRWRSPWDEFTEKGTMGLGQTIREMFVDIANVYDYNAYKDNSTHFLANVVPNVYEYLHEINYEKFYKTTTSDEELAMAFSRERGLFDLINKVVASLYEGYEYDKYIVEKYMLCRRMVDGTMTSHALEGSTIREKVAEMKDISNKMTFRKPDYNPAGVRSFSNFEDQFVLLDTAFDGAMSVEVLATSYFRNDAMLKSNLAIIDGFADHDTNRLSQLLGDAYIPFTNQELQDLQYVAGVIIDRNFFQVYNYYYDNRATEFFNPESLRTNHWLHTKKVLSTSPYAPACIFCMSDPNITDITVTPSSATVEAGQSLKLSVSVVSSGFANKAVTWTALDVSDDPIDGVTIDERGVLKIASTVANNTAVYVYATSVQFTDLKGTATITVSNANSPTEAPTEVPTQP